ncbi:alpha/beta hydrolase [Desertivirga brevis]|uniref:alpha/beta hydrolase n=1 Tax=Desertivirga brevis TaxID=2810310 RepID=UPI001A95F00F|nr:alpha/beta hydrolase [Pedobacter sp. SYSU D00873]
MNYKWVLILAFALQVLVGNITVAQVLPPSNYSLSQNMVYKSVGEWNGSMDIYVPRQSGRKRPLIIFIHGGGWVHGKKEQETDFAMFFEKNFVVANIEYRVARQAVAPAAIEDSKCALQYLIANADTYKIDRKKIVIMGISAGGHLALMTGLTAKDAIFNDGCTATPDKKSKVAAIIDVSGISDLNQWDALKKTGSASRDWLDGREADISFLHGLSPISYIRKSSPPVFIVHGNKDRTVPFEQSKLLNLKLQRVGVPTEFKEVKNGGHALSKQIKEEVKIPLFDFLKRFGVR